MSAPFTTSVVVVAAAAAIIQTVQLLRLLLSVQQWTLTMLTSIERTQLGSLHWRLLVWPEDSISVTDDIVAIASVLY